MQKLRQQKGFTIIEIMIVLAIAALIMLIVFLAVPALQRSSRNTQRKNDAGNILAAINTFVTNNNGSLPTQNGTTPTNMNLSQAIKGIHLGYYNSNNVEYYTGSGVPSPCPTVGTGNGCGTSPNEVNTEDVIFMPGYTCSNNNPQAGSARGFAVVYEVETGSSSAQEQCTAS